MTKLPKALLFLLIITSSLKAQYVPVPLSNDVYNFLLRLSVKGIVAYNDEVKPLSRTYIAEKLNEVMKNKSRLSSLEAEELKFHTREYEYEISKLNKESIPPKLQYFSGLGEDARFRFFAYYDSAFVFCADPIFNYRVDMRSGHEVVKRDNGISSYGYFNNWAFRLDVNDYIENGPFIDKTRDFSPETGYSYKSNRNNYLNYDDVNALISFSWNWGNISLAKDYMNWGSGRAGKIILSDKAPSFPMIRLDLFPFDWLDFTYIHGYLNSGVVDSGTVRINTLKSRKHYSLIEKYFVAHILSLRPFSNLQLSLGESVVYSDRFEPVYLIPFIFFRMADHYLNFTSATAGNAQMFGDLSYKIPLLRSRFYSTLFIDEFSFENVWENKNYPSALAYTLGLQVVDPFINGTELCVEYTRINPFVYYHSDDAQGYSNYNYQMGHWIGSNGDQIYSSYEQRIIRGLKATAWIEYIRKGSKEAKGEARYQKYQTFLFGQRTNYTFWGAEVSYEIIHNLKAILSYRYSGTALQQTGKKVNNITSDVTAGFGFGL